MKYMRTEITGERLLGVIYQEDGEKVIIQMGKKIELNGQLERLFLLN